jgi:hypothetical protein
MFEGKRFGLTVEHQTGVILSSISAQQSAMLGDLIIQALPTGTQDGSNPAPVLTHLRKNSPPFSNLRSIAIL